LLPQTLQILLQLCHPHLPIHLLSSGICGNDWVLLLLLLLSP